MEQQNPLPTHYSVPRIDPNPANLKVVPESTTHTVLTLSVCALQNVMAPLKEDPQVHMKFDNLVAVCERFVAYKR